MKNPDRYERAKNILRLRSKQAEQRAASLVIHERIEAEKAVQQRQLQVQNLHKHVAKVLNKFDQSSESNDFLGLESIRIHKRGLFGREYYVDEPGWHLGDAEETTHIRSDEVKYNIGYYLLINGTFAKGSALTYGGSPVVNHATPENIVDSDAHIPILRKLWDMAGRPE